MPSRVSLTSIGVRERICFSRSTALSCSPVRWSGASRSPKRTERRVCAFAALLCGCSAAVGALLRKTWAQTDELERRRVEDLRGLVDRYRTEEGSIESRCAHAARTFDLTRREEEVLALLLKGCTRSEIARELFVSGDTVKTHIRNLYRKTGVTGKDELVQAIGGSGLV